MNEYILSKETIDLYLNNDSLTIGEYKKIKEKILNRIREIIAGILSRNKYKALVQFSEFPKISDNLIELKNIDISKGDYRIKDAIMYVDFLQTPFMDDIPTEWLYTENYIEIYDREVKNAKDNYLRIKEDNDQKLALQFDAYNILVNYIKEKYTPIELSIIEFKPFYELTQEEKEKLVGEAK